MRASVAALVPPSVSLLSGMGGAAGYAVAFRSTRSTRIQLTPLTTEAVNPYTEVVDLYLLSATGAGSALTKARIPRVRAAWSMFHSDGSPGASRSRPRSRRRRRAAASVVTPVERVKLDAEPARRRRQRRRVRRAAGARGGRRRLLCHGLAPPARAISPRTPSSSSSTNSSRHSRRLLPPPLVPFPRRRRRRVWGTHPLDVIKTHVQAGKGRFAAPRARAASTPPPAPASSGTASRPR